MFSRISSRFALFSYVAVFMASVGAVLLTGCTLESNSVSSAVAAGTVVPMGELSGTVMGGETPISNATVILWETDNTSNATYGSTGGKQLATSTTGSGGYFSFGGTSYTCDAGQYAYITSTGGDVANGGGIYNDAQVQVVAVGPCTALTSSTFVVVNEISTVAAAYALGSFMSVSQNGPGSQLVYIGAPANNNAATGSCSGTGASMTCTAAGLKHAFLNASYLSNSVGTSGSLPNGAARQTLPSTFAQSANTEVPAAVINSLADVLQICTNSASGNGTVSPALYLIGTGGSGYVAPTVTFTGGAGSGAAGTADMTGLSAISVSNGGGSYTVAPTVSFSGGGSGAVGTAVLTGGVVTSVTIVNPGTGYSSDPTVTITAGTGDTTGTGATATAAIGTDTGTITAVHVTSRGSGYTQASPPTVTFADASGPGSGATGTAKVLTTSTNCASLFSAATPPTGTAPTDTLTAIMNIAKYPLNNAATISGLVPSSGAAFQSILSAAPHDWSIAIYYGTTGGTTLTGYLDVPQYVVLDANDDVFVAIGSQSSSSSAGYTGGIAALGSYGSTAWVNALSSAICVSTGELAADMNGYVWQTVPATSTSTGCTATTFNGNTNTTTTAQAIFGYQASTGTMIYGFLATGTPSVQSGSQAIGLDRYSDIWYARNSTSCTTCLFELPFTTGSPGTYGAATNSQNSLVSINQLLLDANSNVYMSDIKTTTNGNLYLLANTATSGTPTYGTSPAAFTTAEPCGYDMGMALDKNNNVYADSYCTTGTQFKVSEFTPTLNAGGSGDSFNSAVNTYTAPILSGATSEVAAQGEVDGNGVFWFTNFDSVGGLYFQATPGSSYLSSGQALAPVFFSAGGGGTTPSSNNAAAANTRVIAIDSTGSIWTPTKKSSTATNAVGWVAQILGPGAPTWPLLQYAVYGTKPQ